MDTRLVQIITLIAYGNEYLSSTNGDAIELFPSHSTFQDVASVTFRKQRMSTGTAENTLDLAKTTAAWFSKIKAEAVKYLKLDLLNLQKLPPTYATSIFTAGSNWVIQTDQGRVGVRNGRLWNHCQRLKDYGR